MNIKKNTVFYRVLSLTLSNIGLQLLGFIYRIFLSRVTGAEGMGVYQLVMPYYSVIMAFSVTGLTMAVSRLTAQYLALGNIRCARHVVSRSLMLFFMLFTAVAIPVLLYSDFISSSILGDSRTRISLLIILPCLLCTGIENIFKNFFFGSGHLKPPIVSELTEQSVRFAAVAALLLFFRPQDAGSASALIVCGMVISEIGSVGILTYCYRRSQKKLPLPPSSCPVVREIGSIAVPIALSALLNNLLASANSILIPQRLIASGMSRDAAISSFGVLFGMTMPLLSLPVALLSALTVVMVPKMSEGIARGAASHLRRHAGKAIQTTGLLAFPAIGILLPLGQELCQLLYRQPNAGEYMLPLCLATLFSYYQISLSAILNAIGMQRRAAVIIIVGGIVQLIGTWLVGIPAIGIWGFLMGEIVSSILMAVMSFVPIVSRLSLNIRWRNWFVTPLLSSILAGLVARLVDLLAKGDGLSIGVSSVLALAAAAAVYLLALRLQGTSLRTYLKKISVPQ